MIKVGLIGYGGIGSVHYDAYKTKENVEIVAVADVRTDLAKEKLVSASSVADKDINVNDNSTATKWLSNVEEKPYITIDLGQSTEIDEAEILWDSLRQSSSI